MLKLIIIKVVWKEILGQFEQIKGGMSKVETELAHYPAESSSEDQFGPVMTVSFIYLFNSLSLFPFSFTMASRLCRPKNPS